MPHQSRILPVVLMAALLFAVSITNQKLQASGGVDMVLVVALDVSASVDDAEFNLMREGLARAVSSPEVINAVAAGRHGAVVLNVVQWSGFMEQEIKIGWTRLSGQIQHLNFAEKVRQMPRRYHDGATDLGGAIDHARKLILAAPFQTSRRVIDIAGDGTNNVNRSPQFERDRAVSDGITINGLTVNDIPGGLINYYINFVIGGDGAFVENTTNYAGFEQAMRRKLVREINPQYLF